MTRRRDDNAGGGAGERSSSWPTTSGRCWTSSGSTATCSGAATPTSGPAGRSTAARWRRSASSRPRRRSRTGRLPHSLHGYFLRAGRSDLPVILEVDRDRDGRSFSARHVNAVQEGEVIFSMVTSFHAETRSGGRRRRRSTTRRGARCPSRWRRHAGGWNPLLEVREVTQTDFLKGVFTDCAWVRSTHTAVGRSFGASSRAHLPVGHRHRVRAEAAGVGRVAAVRRSTTPCGSKSTSAPTTGSWSTCGP